MNRTVGGGFEFVKFRIFVALKQFPVDTVLRQSPHIQRLRIIDNLNPDSVDTSFKIMSNFLAQAGAT